MTNHPFPSWLTVGFLLAAGLTACGGADHSPEKTARETMSDTQARTTSDSLPEPPLAEKREHVVSAPAGERNDPWYWLRDDSREDPEMLAYLEAENAYAEAVLADVSGLRGTLFEEMRSRIKDDDSSVPFFDRGYWYYTRFEAGMEYPIHARRQGHLEAEEEVLLDVNELAEGHDFYSVGDRDVSMSGRYLAWLEDTVGRRQYRLFIRDLATGEDLDTGLTGISSVSWSASDEVLYYVENEPETLRSWRVRRYRVGSGEPGEIVHQEDDTAFYTSVSRTTSNAYNTVYLRSTVASEMRIVEADAVDRPLRVFLPRERDHEYQADHLGERWIIRTNFRAPNFRIVSAPLDAHADRERWTNVIAHRDDVFVHGFDAFENFLAVSERSNALRRIRVLDWDSGESDLLEFDEPAYTAVLGTNRDQSAGTLRFVYASLTTPKSTWELDVASGERSLLKREEVPGGYDPSEYRTRREWAVARDGERIPVSILHHRDTPLDGSAPLYQYGYGSYGFTNDPAFSAARLSLVDRGFVFAIAHVRGGQAMGRRWYDDGRMLNKINTFNDFVDVTDYLVESGLVDGERVFAVGGSAGGLLVGAVANRAPDRYLGIAAHVPFVDIVTTMLDESIPLTTNEYDEWGNPNDPAYYEYMLSYSPYDNVTEQDYPAMLVTTGLWDSQVQYWEPAKWVARLRAEKTDDNPLLFKTNMEAGHGGASGRFRRLEQTAMEYAFFLDLAGLSADRG
ncbi:MAG: prolyl oligopeptidase family serine peptidase [Gammaproteobacteria bacterium]|jgi:oligopeptidase B|nr:prolyl oligopeptidase family serine peptidase [Gammaproteobacteria bacterium]